jgi:hypothetical protein
MAPPGGEEGEEAGCAVPAAGHQGEADRVEEERAVLVGGDACEVGAGGRMGTSMQIWPKGRRRKGRGRGRRREVGASQRRGGGWWQRDGVGRAEEDG